MKNNYDKFPPYRKATAGRAEPIFKSVGVSFLGIGSLLFAIVLLAVVPKLYNDLLGVIGSDVDQLPLLRFLSTAGLGLLVGVVVSALLFALLLSRSRRPGLALFIEGMVLLACALLLWFAVSLQAGRAMADITHSLEAIKNKPLFPL